MTFPVFVNGKTTLRKDNSNSAINWDGTSLISNLRILVEMLFKVISLEGFKRFKSKTWCYQWYGFATMVEKKRRLKGCVKMCNVFFITHQMLLVQSLVFDNKLVP